MFASTHKLAHLQKPSPLSAASPKTVRQVPSSLAHTRTHEAQYDIFHSFAASYLFGASPPHTHTRLTNGGPAHSFSLDVLININKRVRRAGQYVLCVCVRGVVVYSIIGSTRLSGFLPVAPADIENVSEQQAQFGT